MSTIDKISAIPVGAIGAAIGLVLMTIGFEAAENLLPNNEKIIEAYEKFMAAASTLWIYGTVVFVLAVLAMDYLYL